MTLKKEIRDQLREILEPLHIVFDDADTEDVHNPNCTIFHTSRHHPGVHYRLDIVDGMPELLVHTPSDIPPRRYDTYRVTCKLMAQWLLDLPAVTDSIEPATYHMLFAIGEILKINFWKFISTHESDKIDVEHIE